jgi:hypothetical protein
MARRSRGEINAKAQRNAVAQSILLPASRLGGSLLLCVKKRAVGTLSMRSTPFSANEQLKNANQT